MMTLLIGLGGAQKAPAHFLIERVGGAWEVREKGRKDRLVETRYDVIAAGSQIKCVKSPCTITYSTDGGPRPLFSKPPVLNRWVTVPSPSEPPVAPMPADLVQILDQIGRRGGAKKASEKMTTCKGDLPMLAPSCNDTIDPLDFRVMWRVNSDDKVYALLIKQTDSGDSRRWDRIDAQAGEFQSAAVQAFLTSLQQNDQPVNVTVTLKSTEAHAAVRTLTLPSSADGRELRKSLTSLDHLPDLPRHLGYLKQYLNRRMWSNAAGIARMLLQEAPRSLEIQKYVLLGFCNSDFDEQIASLRSVLLDAGVSGLCDDDGGADR